MSPARQSRAQARAIDRAASEICGLPTLVLMEHAGRSAAELVAQLVGAERPGGRVVVFCGGGNNGGDGFVIARFLDAQGLDVECLCLAPLSTTQGDARFEREIAARSGLVLRDVPSAESLAAELARLAGERAPLVIVDALLGTGFTGTLRPELARAIEGLNALHDARSALTVAVDLPSGLDCDLGTLADPTVRADVTATFVAEKVGFGTPAARGVLGRVVVLGIGAPRAALEHALAQNAANGTIREA